MNDMHTLLHVKEKEEDITQATYVVDQIAYIGAIKKCKLRNVELFVFSITLKGSARTLEIVRKEAAEAIKERDRIYKEVYCECTHTI